MEPINGNIPNYETPFEFSPNESRNACQPVEASRKHSPASVRSWCMIGRSYYYLIQVSVGCLAGPALSGSSDKLVNSPIIRATCARTTSRRTHTSRPHEAGNLGYTWPHLVNISFIGDKRKFSPQLREQSFAGISAIKVLFYFINVFRVQVPLWILNLDAWLKKLVLYHFCI